MENSLLQYLEITQPDDWHVHLRDNPNLSLFVQHTAKQFHRVIVMPNLIIPISTVEMAEAYRSRILECLKDNNDLQPLMTLYLTDNTTSEEIRLAKKSAFVKAVKLYPAGATTNSDCGVTNIENVYDCLSVMEEVDLPLLVHGEVTTSEVDVFDREAVFIDTVLNPLIQRFPNLRVVLEHITTKQGVQFVLESSNNVAGTITPHHLLLNRNDIFQGGINPHHYCLPILKREEHRNALLSAATGDTGKFFLGTDSAPHPQSKKESSCGCAGIYSAHAAIELYAEAFESVNALDKLEGFASFYGADFYKLPRNKTKIKILKQDWQVPSQFQISNDIVIPFKAEKMLHWKLDT